MPHPESQPRSTKKSAVGPIVGGVVGGLALISAVVLGAFLWRRRAKRQSSAETRMREAGIEPQTVPYNYEPCTETSQNSRGQAQPSQSSSSIPVAPSQSGTILSTKAREAAGLQTQQTPPSTIAGAPGTSAASVVSGGASTGSAAPSGAAAVSPLDVVGLRVEVENLRRVMQEMQVDRLEAPPGYQDVQTQGPNTSS